MGSGSYRGQVLSVGRFLLEGRFLLGVGSFRSQAPTRGRFFLVAVSCLGQVSPLGWYTYIHTYWSKVLKRARFLFAVPQTFVLVNC